MKKSCYSLSYFISLNAFLSNECRSSICERLLEIDKIQEIKEKKIIDHFHTSDNLLKLSSSYRFRQRLIAMQLFLIKR